MDQQIDAMAGTSFKTPRTDRQIRHNKLMLEAGVGAWYGQLDAHTQIRFKHISATAFDELINRRI